MTGLIFVDSNVLICRRDASEPEKQPRAGRWLRFLWGSRRGRLSSQVLTEFYTIATRRLRPGLPAPEARDEVREFFAWRPVVLSTKVVEGAWDIEEQYHLSFWDALIVSAARAAECTYLLTEDLQDGQDFDGLRVVDPFRHEPSELGSQEP